MPGPTALLHAANVVAGRRVPLFGIALLGWSPGKLLVVCCADTIASLLALMNSRFWPRITAVNIFRECA
jgi:hypothetical protein